MVEDNGGRHGWETMVGGMSGRQWWEAWVGDNVGRHEWEAMVGGMSGRQWWEAWVGGNGGSHELEAMMGGMSGRQWWEAWAGGNGGGRQWWETYNILITSVTPVSVAAKLIATMLRVTWMPIYKKCIVHDQIAVLMYNPLGWSVKHWVRIPLPRHDYIVKNSQEQLIEFQVMRI